MAWGKKTVIALAAMTTISAGTAVTAQQADAAPLQQLPTAGDQTYAFGNHSYCRGGVRIRYTAPERKRGYVRMTITSLGFTGDGATWKKNPRCTVVFSVAVMSVEGKVSRYRATFGTKRGELFVRDVRTGSGPISISTAPLAPGTDVGFNATVQSYALVP